MKLTRMLFSSSTLNRGTVRHFSDGDFALPMNGRGGLSYVDSIRLRRPGTLPAAARSACPGDLQTPRPKRGLRGLWSYLR